MERENVNNETVEVNSEACYRRPLGNYLNWNEKIVWIVECEELVKVCYSVKCERYKKIGDFLEGSDS